MNHRLIFHCHINFYTSTGGFSRLFQGIHFLNQPWYISIVMAIIRPFLKQKLRERVSHQLMTELTAMGRATFSMARQSWQNGKGRKDLCEMVYFKTTVLTTCRGYDPFCTVLLLFCSLLHYKSVLSGYLSTWVGLLSNGVGLFSRQPVLENTPTPHFEQPLNFIAHGCIFETL